MKSRTLLLASLALVATTVGLAAQDPAANPRDVLQRISTLQTDFRKRQAAGESVSEAALKAEIDKVVQDAIQGVDVAKVPTSDAADWLRVFQIANREKEVTTLAQRAYMTRAFELMDMETLVIRGLIKEGKLDEARRHIRDMGFGLGPAQLGQFHLGLQSALREQAAKSPAEVMAIYDTLIERVHFDTPITPNDKQWGPVVYANFMSERYAVQYNAGQKEAALKGLKALTTLLASKYKDSKDAHANSAASYAQKTIDRLTSATTQGGLVGAPAPALAYDRTLGSFPGPDSLKGKVVILDFMAHWCGPCKAALPDLTALQDRLGAKGLQVVSLTGYYGYFGARQGIDPATEYGAMKGFVQDYKMTWPVLFDATGKNNRSFGVSGIPQLVVIDRKGIVRKVDVGYTKESFAETAKVVERLLEEAK